MTSGRAGKRGRGTGAGEKRKSKKDDLRSKNREAQRRFREKQKCALSGLDPYCHVVRMHERPATIVCGSVFEKHF